MSDAPETIYTNKSGTMLITPPAIPLHETDLAWCRAGLPATDAQAMANPKVQALVEALRFYDEVLTAFSSATDTSADVADETLDRDGGRLARAALAALEAKPSINWRDDPEAIVEDDEPAVGRDYE